MIKIIPKGKIKNHVKIKPYYQLIFNYTIGDADGDITEKVIISHENPFLERFVKLINSLKPLQGNWGLSLDYETLEKLLEEKQINKDDFEFLKRIMFLEDSEFKLNDEEEIYANEFEDGIMSEIECSFLTLNDVELIYVNEFKEKFETEIS